MKNFTRWLKEDLQDLRLYVDVPKAKEDQFCQLYPASSLDQGNGCWYIDMAQMAADGQSVTPISQALLTDLTQAGYQAICATDDGKITASYNSSKTKRYFPKFAPQAFM